MATMAETETETETEEISDPDSVRQQQIEALRRSNAALQQENKMFEYFFSRMDLQDLFLQPSAKSLAIVAQLEQSRELTLAQKCYMGQKVLNDLEQELEQLTRCPEKVINNYKASIQETNIRLAEIKKESHEFDRAVTSTLWGNETIMSEAQKVIHFIESRIKHKETLIEKLHFKNRALKMQKRKLQHKLHQSKEITEVLHWVDFEHLSIDNNQYLELINAGNQELHRLKLQTGDAQQGLTSYKKKLQIQMCESERLRKNIAAHEGRLVKIAAEAQQAEKGRSKAEDLTTKLKTQLADYRVPGVLDYVSSKTSRLQLRQSIKTWEHKVEVKEMELKTMTKAWNKCRNSAGAATNNRPPQVL